MLQYFCKWSFLICFSSIIKDNYTLLGTFNFEEVYFFPESCFLELFIRIIIYSDQTNPHQATPTHTNPYQATPDHTNPHQVDGFLNICEYVVE